MKTKLLLFAIIFCFVFNGLQAQVDVDDSLALVDLYKSTNGKNWVVSTNWLTKKPVSTWWGIVVVNGRVGRIYLNGNSLSGPLPESLGDLDSLTHLQLSQSNLTGHLPSSIGNLGNLDFLDLSRTLINGDIPPGVGNLKKIRTFWIDDARLTGSIPDTLGSCSNLSYLIVSNNQLTGTLPASFKKLSKLSQLWVSYNKLSGTLPDVFAEEAPLADLEVSSNHFTGPFPFFVRRFSNLAFLFMGQNDFSGEIPAWVGQLKNLEYLDLASNQFSGRIPASFDSLTKIQELFLYDNHLTLDFNPNFSGRKNRTTTLLLHKNNLTFNGLEYFVRKYSTISYKPQADIEVHHFQNKLSVSAGGTLSNNTYRWFQVGESTPFTISGDSTFQPTKSGRYYARITNSIVTGLTLKTDTLVYQMPSQKSIKIFVSPNPARDRITLSGLDEKQDVKIAITDASGYVWMKAMSRQQSAFRVDVSGLKAGNYLVSVVDGKDVRTVMFVKE